MKRALFAYLTAITACGGGNPATMTSGGFPASAQRPGDPAKGYTALVNNGYITCGIPQSLYNEAFGAADPSELIPGRTGANATLPYYYTAFTAASGAALVSANCLTCHAGTINGTLTVGLGNTDRDFTVDQNAEAAGIGAALISDPTELIEFNKWADRVTTIAPYSVTKTIGTNPADSFTGVLFAHHDPKTLAWSDTPLITLPTPQVIPVDVPPWWRMKKKSTMFYTAGGRGDHARIMMTASTLCTDTVAEATAIDSYFPDIRAYIYSIEPPKYPFAIDATLTSHGEQVFAQTCSRCHGTYGTSPTYPNLLTTLAEIGTDPLLASGSTEFAQRFVDWFNESFYGALSQFEPEQGYVPPPLDGIWATAPFLHNGSVPTLWALLKSSDRPTYWTRFLTNDQTVVDSTKYDTKNVGWQINVPTAGQSAATDATAAAKIYDTTLPGYANTGHTFGDALSDADRTALIEYLKTL